MKNIFIICLICLSYSCQEDVEPIIELTHYPLTAAYDYLPMELANSEKQAIFVNFEGHERRFNLNFEETIVDIFSAQNGPYSANQIMINYNENSDRNFTTVRIRAGIFDIDNSELHNVISCETSRIPLQRPKNFVFIAGKEQQNTLNFKESYTAFGKSYNDIHFNSVTENSDIFNYHQFHYSDSLGIIAFKGYGNDFWVLDRFE